MPLYFEYPDELNRGNTLSDAETILRSRLGDSDRDIRAKFSDYDAEQGRCDCQLLVNDVRVWSHDFGMIPTAQDIADRVFKELATHNSPTTP